MTVWLLDLLAVLATFRLTRLVTQDYLTEGPRKWLQARLPEKPAYLIGCPWCASFWVGGLVAWLTVEWPQNRVLWVVWLALAASGVTGLLATHDPPEDFGVHVTVEGDAVVRTDADPAE